MRGQGASRLLVAGLFALLVACGGDDDDDGDVTDGTDDSGDVADDDGGSDTTIDQLSDAEAAELCAEATDILSSDVFLEFTCYLIAISTYPDDVDLCTADAEDCLATMEPISEFECWIDPDTVAVLPDCASDISAADFQDCMLANVQQIVDFIDGIDCETSFDELPTDPADFELPEECAAIEAACPELFGIST